MRTDSFVEMRCCVAVETKDSKTGRILLSFQPKIKLIPSAANTTTMLLSTTIDVINCQHEILSFFATGADRTAVRLKCS
jgi:hypothetical protein